MKKYKLPKEFAEKWVSALRSGEYKQTTDLLYDTKTCSYCCLGVAAKMQGFDENNMIKTGQLNELLKSDEDNTLVEKYNIPEQIIDGQLSSTFIDLNDNQGKSFAQIADWIEENVEFV